MAIYVPYPAGGLLPGDRVRKLVAIAPAIADPGAYDQPWTVARVEQLGMGRVRIWAHPFGSSVSTTSPANYGSFAELDTVEVYR